MVTDPGSPLDKEARAAGYRVVNADPNVGGRYSALTAFGLVPSGLAGADIEALLDEAESVADLLAEDDEANPGLRLAAAMAGTSPLRDKLRPRRQRLGHRRLRRLGRAAHRREHRQAGHRHPAGRRRRRRRPRGALARRRRHRRPPRRRRRRGHAEPQTADGDAPRSEVPSAAPLGAQMLLWEVATAAAGRLLGINPFDQPDVESAKKAARGLLDARRRRRRRAGLHRRRHRGPRPRRRLARSARRPSPTALAALFGQLDPHHGYVAVMAYLDRLADAQLADVPRRRWRARTGRPDDLRLGAALPALHRPVPQGRPGRPASTCRSPRRPHEDLAVPGPRRSPSATSSPRRPAGDAQVLADHGRPVLRLHLTDHDRDWPS